MTTATVDLDPEAIISDCYPRGSFTWELLIHHGEQVAAKALAVIDYATWLSIDRDFVWQAAMLHDIGIGRVNAPGWAAPAPCPMSATASRAGRCWIGVGCHATAGFVNAMWGWALPSGRSFNASCPCRCAKCCRSPRKNG
ncbi:hypothetical protein [Desulfosarcina cetonica]|uniref:hypothetical protein n=1 Tax=Desulfosarcina cetonica TaxID=90730 RepID=UPI001C47D069|nr:hypothetical protein [Desulfosarcina cetonica]